MERFKERPRHKEEENPAKTESIENLVHVENPNIFRDPHCPHCKDPLEDGTASYPVTVEEPGRGKFKRFLCSGCFDDHVVDHYRKTGNILWKSDGEGMSSCPMRQDLDRILGREPEEGPDKEYKLLKRTIEAEKLKHKVDPSEVSLDLGRVISYTLKTLIPGGGWYDCRQNRKDYDLAAKIFKKGYVEEKEQEKLGGRLTSAVDIINLGLMGIFWVQPHIIWPLVAMFGYSSKAYMLSHGSTKKREVIRKDYAEFMNSLPLDIHE